MVDIKLTKRQTDAVVALGEACKRGYDGTVTPSAFATHFWPGKVFARGNGPWGLGPDASGRHGARMLMTLSRLGLATIVHHDCYWTAKLSADGKALLARIHESGGSE